MMIRLAEKADLPSINQLRLQVHELHAGGRPDIFQPQFNAELTDHIYDIYDDENSEIIAAEIDGKICGFAVVEFIEKPESPYSLARNFLRVVEFGVDKSCRRQGVGTQLFDYIKSFAAEKNLDTVELDMWEFNEGALKFYESVGFKTYRRYMEFKS
ncbi:MAG: GNAT family N-acetyltransferase [Firmicutes bacterium]|nr:GNAT family N-acetyltransferase [Bacillota bacterium]